MLAVDDVAVVWTFQRHIAKLGADLSDECAHEIVVDGGVAVNIIGATQVWPQLRNFQKRCGEQRGECWRCAQRCTDFAAEAPRVTGVRWLAALRMTSLPTCDCR